ncbi:hypothetical protein ACIQU5_32505 [Streptomyces sp. NPDC090306]|uniref:hypothetical protein n=1 Tax=Streptomyces sp. NPDC090306 TaxID=3365961 RepID=UPI00380CE8B0
MTLAALSPIVALLWIVAVGLICIRIGRKAKSARPGWISFLLVGLLPLGAMFAVIGATIPVVVIAAIAGLIIILGFLDWYSLRP